MAVQMQAIATKQSLLEVFQHLDRTSCPYQYNFHLHTCCSDGQLTPIEVVQQALRHQLRGLAITDHHSVAGYLEAAEWLSQASPSLNPPASEECHLRESPLQLWSGTEITASLAGADVHILGFAFTPTHPALAPYLQGESVQGWQRQAVPVIDAIHQAGGVAVLAHPARYTKSPETLIPAAVAGGIDGVETYYCYANPDHWEPSPRQTQRVESLADQFQLLRTAGTDTHGRDILRRI